MHFRIELPDSETNILSWFNNLSIGWLLALLNILTCVNWDNTQILEILSKSCGPALGWAEAEPVMDP